MKSLKNKSVSAIDKLNPEIDGKNLVELKKKKKDQYEIKTLRSKV